MKQEETIEATLSDFPQDVTPQQDKENYYNPVNEYTMEGVYVKTYKSPTAAARALGISSAVVKSCCRGSTLSTVKYNRIFLYKGDSIKQRLKLIKQKEELDAAIEKEILKQG